MVGHLPARRGDERHPHQEHTYLAAQYARSRPRLGYAKALSPSSTASSWRSIYMLVRDQPYHDLGPDYFIRREDPDRRARKLICQLEAIGYTVNA